MTSVYSPGRINIIGEHTDHQGGLVLPVAIKLGLKITGEKSEDKIITVSSQTMDETIEFSIQTYRKQNDWVDYVVGSILQFQNTTGIIASVNIKISSTLLVGSGLSSSAALQVGIIKLLSTLYDNQIDCQTIAEMAWKSETQFVGVECGIMDQMIISCSKTSDPMMIDCKTLEMTSFKLDPSIGFILVDTGESRKLSDSKYNERIAELRKVSSIVEEMGYTFDVLSDLDSNDLNEIRIKWNADNTLFLRLKHVLEENDRVKTYVKLSKQKSFKQAGKLLYASHQSLKNNFEASWEKADQLVTQSKRIDEIHGARMIGAGWGGNILIQCNNDDKDKIRQLLSSSIDWLDHSSIMNIALGQGVHELQV